jgi:hypothetical protein
MKKRLNYYKCHPNKKPKKLNLSNGYLEWKKEVERVLKRSTIKLPNGLLKFYQL